MREEWQNFKEGIWTSQINVSAFIQKNYKPYDGDESFLVGATQSTKDLWAQVLELTKQEREAGGVLDMDTKVISTITSHGPGYINKDLETIVGLQTDKPLKRALMPYGGIRMAEKACKDNGYELVVSSYVNNSDGLQYSKITKVVLKYDYSISLLDISSEKEIVGYAR